MKQTRDNLTRGYPAPFRLRRLTNIQILKTKMVLLYTASHSVLTDAYVTKHHFFSEILHTHSRIFFYWKKSASLFELWSCSFFSFFSLVVIVIFLSSNYGLVFFVVVEKKVHLSLNYGLVQSIHLVFCSFFSSPSHGRSAFLPPRRVTHKQHTQPVFFSFPLILHTYNNTQPIFFHYPALHYFLHTWNTYTTHVNGYECPDLYFFIFMGRTVPFFSMRVYITLFYTLAHPFFSFPVTSSVRILLHLIFESFIYFIWPKKPRTKTYFLELTKIMKCV